MEALLVGAEAALRYYLSDYQIQMIFSAMTPRIVYLAQLSQLMFWATCWA